MGLTLRIVHVDSTCSRPTTGSHHHFLLSVAELMLSTILLQMRNRAQEMKESAFAITPPLEGERSIAMSVFACVCPLAYLRNYDTDFNFSVHVARGNIFGRLTCRSHVRF